MTGRPNPPRRWRSGGRSSISRIPEEFPMYDETEEEVRRALQTALDRRDNGGASGH